MSDTLSVPPALATPAQFQARFPSLSVPGVVGGDILELTNVLVEATAIIEASIGQRVMPFTNLQETHPLYGIDPSEYGSPDSGLPLPWAGSLGMNYANALGASDLVRKMWLDEKAPLYPDLWTYDVSSITLRLSVGGSYDVDLTYLEGPWPDSGMCRFQLGTFSPEGTTAVVVYSGGYTVQIPADLRSACLYQTAKLVMLDAEPQMRKEMSFTELDDQITRILANWARP